MYFSTQLRKSRSLYIWLALWGLLLSTGSEGKEYVFENLQSPYLNDARLVPMRDHLTFHLNDAHPYERVPPKDLKLCDPRLGKNCLDLFPVSDMYVDDGMQGRDFTLCSPQQDMLCFEDSFHGWALYLPRKPSEWTTWKAGERTYFFEGWQRVPFLPASKQVAVIHAFLTSTLEKKREAKALAYPVETYYVDQDTRLVGMVRYTLRDPEWTGLNENRIDRLYWAVDGGLPLLGEKPEVHK
jgi:hypothetical protein